MSADTEVKEKGIIYKVRTAIAAIVIGSGILFTILCGIIFVVNCFVQWNVFSWIFGGGGGRKDSRGLALLGIIVGIIISILGLKIAGDNKKTD